MVSKILEIIIRENIKEGYITSLLFYYCVVDINWSMGKKLKYIKMSALHPIFYPTILS